MDTQTITATFDSRAKFEFAIALKSDLYFDALYNIGGTVYRLHSRCIGANRYHVYVDGNCLVDYDHVKRLVHFAKGAGAHPVWSTIKDVVYDNIDLKFKESGYAIGNTF